MYVPSTMHALDDIQCHLVAMAEIEKKENEYYLYFDHGIFTLLCQKRKALGLLSDSHLC